MYKRQILVTSALPYANGDIHLGHLYEHILTDIWVRFQKSSGHECYFICADDAHGTSIMLRAEKEQLSPEEWIAQVKTAHQADFARFYIGFDHYDSTHSITNRKLSELIYQRLRNGGFIHQREIQQMFDPLKQLFLADRFIKGTCPRCHAADQYGDNCEVCGATYAPIDLIDPISAISGATPIVKSSTHYFFRLPAFSDFLAHWIQSGHVQPQIANKLQEWFASGLNEWDISRDAPYFGFEIPDAPGKYFYVWLDAPIGYLASFKNFCAQTQVDFDSFWDIDSKAEVHHFIGKDIVYFHALFWPAVLHGSNFRTPTSIHCHGFVTINGAKMSKSRGTFIRAQDYAQFLDPEYLRYYFAAKINGKIDDIDLNLNELSARINADLIGKIINIASRCAKLTANLGNHLPAQVSETTLIDQAIATGDIIADYYEKRDYASAIREIIAIADQTNSFIALKEPWKLIKQPGNEAAVLDCCAIALNIFRQIMVYLAPVLPIMTARAQQFLNLTQLDWQSRQQLLLDHSLNEFKPLMQRVDAINIERMLQHTRTLTI